MRITIPTPEELNVETLPVSCAIKNKKGKEIGKAYIRSVTKGLELNITKFKRWTKNDQDFIFDASLKIVNHELKEVNALFLWRF